MKVLTVIWLIMIVTKEASANWDEWWTYDGISGPTYWGVINKAWSLCTKGKYQSPVDINPGILTFDPQLRGLNVDKYPVEGIIYNTGQSLVFKAEEVRRGSVLPINITGGPLTYNYQFEKLSIHWGRQAETGRGSSRDSGGSEHSIGGKFFSGEVQLFGFNSDLYSNMSKALGNPGGVVGVALMVRESERGGNKALQKIVHTVRKVTFKGQSYRVPKISFGDLLPSTDFYITYDGSMTQPGCEEGVKWIILNKPIYLTRLDFETLRSLMQGEKIQPKSPLGPNNRPTQELNFRNVRTNIKVDDLSKNHLNTDIVMKNNNKKSKKEGLNCPDITKEMYYQANL